MSEEILAMIAAKPSSSDESMRIMGHLLRG
jgi:hypothetical protein